mgnify:CR=1 FL=1
MRDKIHKNVKKFGSAYDKLNNEKDKKLESGAPLSYADRAAFGELGEQIYISCCIGDEMFAIRKFYRKFKTKFVVLMSLWKYKIHFHNFIKNIQKIKSRKIYFDMIY